MELKYKRYLYNSYIIILYLVCIYILYRVSKIVVVNLFGVNMFHWLGYYLILILFTTLVLIFSPSRKSTWKSHFGQVYQQINKWFLFLIFFMIIATTFFFTIINSYYNSDLNKITVLE